MRGSKRKVNESSVNSSLDSRPSETTNSVPEESASVEKRRRIGGTTEGEPVEKTQATHYNETSTLQVKEVIGDLFDAPDHAVLVHACNCQGSWGAGIAATFKKKYPEAFKVYKNHCEASSVDELRGTALLIRPQDKKDQPQHFVGCLFTSGGRGRTKDNANDILGRTQPAMQDLLQQIGRASVDLDIREIRMCQINSGLFKVPWVKTKAALEAIEIVESSWPSIVTVYSRD
ncbi:MAG: ADP-ribose 1''-phosphate phosphatase [Bogoriella megaspora]|nr:MAG: ADP-ribose 1''-phosphate phosphatase [Bogoriella megaspora]